MGTRPAPLPAGAAGAAFTALRAAAAGVLLTFALACGPASAENLRREPLERLPTAELTVESAGHPQSFKVWIAATEARRDEGLMFVPSLPAGRGMLFLFDAPQVATFWMKNTLIPLDLLFIAPDGRIIRIAENAVPHSEAMITSMGVVLGVLELAGGSSQRLGFKAGDRVRHPAFTGH